MNRRLLALAMVLGIIGMQSSMAQAEGTKTMKDMLFEKGILTQDEAAMIQDVKLSSDDDRIKFSGDFRLRHESFMNDPGFDRHRQRFRLRLGSEIKISDYTVMVRLASGTGEQVSTNQSFDNLSAQKPIYIDQAFLKWQGEDSRWLTLAGGRMQNPFFRVYSSDIVWDDDFNPEGFAEMMTWKPGTTTVFVNLGQFVLDEDSTDNNDQWLFGQQVGATFTPIEDVTTTLAMSYYEATNVTEGSLGSAGGGVEAPTAQSGNTRSAAVAGPPATTTCPPHPAGALCNDYRVADLTAQIATKVGGLPVAIMADYIQNLADPETSAGETKDTGYQAGFILGKASDPQTWEAAYFYKLAETDATLADISDSDFGNGGLNRKGHIVWVAYNPTKFLQGKVKYSMTEVEDGDQADINRLQADLSIKF